MTLVGFRVGRAGGLTLLLQHSIGYALQYYTEFQLQPLDESGQR